MADATKFKAVKRPCSERRIQANRSNSKRSTGPSAEGCKRSSQNRLRHGMRSRQRLLPGESETDRETLESQIFVTVDPKSPVERILANRLIEREWYRRRGVRATEDKACKTMEAIVLESDDRAAREVERLAPLVDAGNRDALRQLRSFPAGVAYLRDQWTNIHSRLAKDRNLLGTQRRRCFALAGIDALDVLRDHPGATNLLRMQIGVMLGPDAELAAVASFLGETPPEGMDQDEYDIRVTHMRDSLKPRKESFLELKGYVADALAELQAHALKIQELAARRLEQAVGGAAADSSPEGIRLMNYITNNEKGFDAALRRIELGRKPDRPGSKRAPKESGAAASVAAEVAAEPQPEPPAVAVTVAADVQEPVAAAVPDGDAPTPTMTGVTEITQDDVPRPLTAEAGAEFSTYEAIEEPAQAGAGAEFSTYEAIEKPAQAGAGAEFSTYEGIEKPAQAGAGAEFSTYEAIEEPAQAEVGAGFAELEAVLDDMGDGTDLEPDSPEFVRLREACRQIEATYGAGRRRDDDPARGCQAGAGRTDSPLARAEERFRRRQEDLSRQLDDHYGINGERPEPVTPEPVFEGVRGPNRPEPGDSS
jgi:hypothetical protein